jgi:hypothetical protein
MREGMRELQALGQRKVVNSSDGVVIAESGERAGWEAVDQALRSLKQRASWITGRRRTELASQGCLVRGKDVSHLLEV